MDWHRRRTELVGRHVSRLDEADRQALRAALPALRRLAVHLHEQAEDGRDTPKRGRGGHMTEAEEP